MYFAAFNWSNPWLVGVGTAVISGLLVNFISRFLLSQKDDKELRQKIDAANQEVVYALRPSIAEGSMPTQSTIEALVRATARKYALGRDNLMTIEEFADELIKQVMDSSFISNDQKNKYCASIGAIKNPPKTRISKNLSMSIENSELIRFGTADPYYAYRKRLTRQLNYLLTLIAVFLTLATTFITFNEDLKSTVQNILSVAFGVALIPIAFISFQQLRRREILEKQGRLHGLNDGVDKRSVSKKKKK
jgi:hypothetical protein